MSETKKCGFVAIIGRPNVGKSTLLNTILGHKLSITARKPQTTRHQILGVKTQENTQVIYVDTPGIHGQYKKALNKQMNRAALSAMIDVDVILFIVEGLQWTPDDERILQKLASQSAPIILVVNKVDKVKEKAQLLPFIEKLCARQDFLEVVPVSAAKKDNIQALESCIAAQLPESVFYFPQEQASNRDQTFFIAETIREKCIRALGDELPYASTVQIEAMKQEKGIMHIHALIWVERDGQKAIVIGKGGETLKSIASHARRDLEAMVGMKVNLQVWVKVKDSWSDDERALQQFGLGGDEG